MLEGYTDATVLIVDDQLANVVLLRRMLEAEGLTRVSTVTDPRDAITEFRQVKPDLVLLDLHMPHMDGFGLLETLTSLLPADEYVPVIVLTADPSEQSRRRALSLGANDFVGKPFDHTDVILRARNLLHTRSLHVGLRRHNGELAAQLRANSEEASRRIEGRERRTRRIQQVIAGEGMSMVFQPIVDLRTGTVVGAEALARFADEPVRPDAWFAEAAALGLGTELELVAVRTAFSQLAELPAPTTLSVNVAPTTVIDLRFTDAIGDVPASRLVLELTEHARVADYDQLSAALARLRERGIKVAVDDTGAGFAGLEHILRLVPDVIKLDMILTRGIDHDPVRRALAQALLTFSGELGATVVAEGVETPEEFEALRELGVPWGQGYYLARPGSMESLRPQLR
jgi:EAL domain-containing protein (putative c-di-GMP-specific phosphodiesterase class I)/AmiR/NasT family two-component response regulator